MAITLGSNLPSIQAQRRLGDASASTSRLYEQLSSGLRITRPSDDAAGLAVAEDLNSKTRVYTRAILNGNDGQSVLALADATLSGLSEIVTRIRELSEQSANGTYSVSQRKALDTEAQALAKEYFRVSRATAFNRTNLFDGTLSDGIRFQLGYGTEGSLQSRIGGNLGTGTFANQTSMAMDGSSSNDIAMGDINGDGNIDMVTVGANGPSATISIRLGDGSGSFGAATSISDGSGSWSAITLGDLNGDGILDLVTAGTIINGYVSVRLGNGNGTFLSSASYAADATSTTGVTLGDINGDGVLDLVTSGKVGTGSGSNTIRLGTGSGTFGAITTISHLAFDIEDVIVADFNGDGILDLGTAGQSSARSSGFIAVSLGNGNGTFKAIVTYASAVNSSTGVFAGDLNGDGILDLVASGTSAATTGMVSVQLGNGDGTFRVSTSYAAEAASSKDVTLGDVNGDGNLDLITAGTQGVDGYTTIRLGTGTGTFGTAVSYASDTNTSYGVTTADLNGDGVLDIITAGLTDGASGSATTLLGNTRDGVSPLLSFSLKTKADSLQAMGMLDRTLTNLSLQRGVVGAFQSRISVALNTLQSSRDGYSAAESMIRDVDVADATSNLVRNQILQSAATSILAQANQLPAMALQLLR